MNSPQAKGRIEIEAELCTPSATCQLVHYHFSEPPDSKMSSDKAFRLELCLTSRHRSTRACYREHWSPYRYENVGDLFVLPPGMTMSARSDEATSLTSFVCELAPSVVLDLFEKSPEPTDQLLVTSLDFQDATVRSLLLRLAEETRHPGFASELLVEQISTQIAIEMVRCGMRITEHAGKGGLAPWQLRRIDERLQEIDSGATLAELAALCRLSVSQLARGFRASRGCSIGAYVANSQMEHAKRLLATDESVTAIAGTLGFSSSSNFCYAFRRAMGITPRQFRQRLLSTH